MRMYSRVSSRSLCARQLTYLVTSGSCAYWRKIASASEIFAFLSRKRSVLSVLGGFITLGESSWTEWPSLGSARKIFKRSGSSLASFADDLNGLKVRTKRILAAGQFLERLTQITLIDVLCRLRHGPFGLRLFPIDLRDDLEPFQIDI